MGGKEVIEGEGRTGSWENVRGRSREEEEEKPQRGARDTRQNQEKGRII